MLRYTIRRLQYQYLRPAFLEDIVASRTFRPTAAQPMLKSHQNLHQNREVRGTTSGQYIEWLETEIVRHTQVR